MAKMTDAEKTTKRASRKAHEALYHARYREYTDARLRMDDVDSASPESAALNAANEAKNDLVVERNKSQDAIRAKIRELEAQLRGIDAIYEPKFSAVNDVLAKARDAHRKARDVLKSNVEAKFPDMNGVWYSSAWNPDLVPKPVSDAK